jgi:hypothetical protein
LSLDPEQRSIQAEEARQLLENRHFKAAFEDVAELLEHEAMTCDPDNKDKAQRIILCKRLLGQIKASIERKVVDGEFAKAEIEALNPPKKFWRLIR